MISGAKRFGYIYVRFQLFGTFVFQFVLFSKTNCFVTMGYFEHSLHRAFPKWSGIAYDCAKFFGSYFDQMESRWGFIILKLV